MAKKRNPRILIVTPEITYLPNGMGNMANNLNAKAGGLADVSASLVSSLFKLGADVHVALPHYRRMFHVEVANLISGELRKYQSKLPDARIHLAEDRIFYYRENVYSTYHHVNPKLALAFQREVLNNIIQTVQPDLIHCNDWMTGLVPALAKRLNIPCLFTVHNIFTMHSTLADMEDRGIDAAEFWKYLYFEHAPFNYEESRNNNQVDLLVSGIFASHFINTVSPTFLDEVIDGRHDWVPDNVRAEVAAKRASGCAVGILNAPDPSFNPENDPTIEKNFDSTSHVAGKRANKVSLQKKLGLNVDPDAPMLFWPSRLDPMQKGCQLLSDILFNLVSKYWKQDLQVVFVANGAYQPIFRDIVKWHNLHERVAVCDFEEGLSHHGYAASDFMIMPSRFEPCGLPQMVSCLYGSLPIVHDTGGLHDTVEHLNISKQTGNGFLFENYDANGLMWAIDQAMEFYNQPTKLKNDTISRIMDYAKNTFNHDVTAKAYFDIYEKMLDRPIVKQY
jgi:ADP-glucose type glycogen/starch synthase